MRLTGPWSIWAVALAGGFRCLPREPRIGLKRVALPVSYWRTREFTYVCQRLQLPAGSKVLDVGSPKELAAYLAQYRGYEVVASDILERAVSLSERYAGALGLSGTGPGRVRSEVQDGRRLTYPDCSFDAVFSVSVLEHIPDCGDTEAIRELVRVVKPGGLVVVTTPFDRTYRETFVDRPVYERARHGSEPVFYQRHYDEPALRERLLSVSGVELVDRELWGEGRVRVEQALMRWRKVRTLLSPLEPAMALLSLRKVGAHDGTNPMAAFFTFRKL